MTFFFSQCRTLEIELRYLARVRQGESSGARRRLKSPLEIAVNIRARVGRSPAGVGAHKSAKQLKNRRPRPCFLSPKIVQPIDARMQPLR